jgi:hypothetical protein
MFLLDIGSYVPIYMAACTRRQAPSAQKFFAFGGKKT